MRTIPRGMAVPFLTMLLLCAGMITAGCVEAQDAEQRVAADIGGGRAVLVTGASSGIGRTTTEYLAANGFFVYAGARKQADLDALNELESVQAIRLDVNIQEEIDAAVETVRAEGRGLYAVINNAGVVILAPLVEVSEEDLAFQMNVNVFGPYRVTKAFAPMLIESQGRVATTGSISGILTWTFGGPYTMSKHAIEAFTDVLAAELAPFGVKVSVGRVRYVSSGGCIVPAPADVLVTIRRADPVRRNHEETKPETRAAGSCRSTHLPARGRVRAG